MRVGPGNILGVTGAIAVGGPGALFWMWISAFFGMASGILHGGLMLLDMSLLLSLNDISLWSCFILSIVLFLVTGIYLMLLRKRWQGIVVALFSLIAWIQPGFFFVVQQ